MPSEWSETAALGDVPDSTSFRTTGLDARSVMTQTPCPARDAARSDAAQMRDPGFLFAASNRGPGSAAHHFAKLMLRGARDTAERKFSHSTLPAAICAAASRTTRS